MKEKSHTHLVSNIGIIKEKTIAGDFAKVYFKVTYGINEKIVAIIIRKMVLSNRPDLDMPLVKSYSNRYLYLQDISFKAATFLKMANFLNESIPAISRKLVKLT